jgi:NADPH:quinone reductase-like Zn-dependent oxidoreductase
MRAIVITSPGGPEVLREQELPTPSAGPGFVVVRVRAFGLNHAEVYFRRGLWGEVARVTGIECVGEVHDAGDGALPVGTRVLALLGGMGRSIDGSHAEFVRVPATSVVPVQTRLDWVDLAALPESYATAWAFLHHNLAVRDGQTLLVRGGTSALGQASINVAVERGVRVLATTRSRGRFELLEALGALPLLDSSDLGSTVQALVPGGVDAVLDIVGTTTVLDSLRMARHGGRVALAGFLGGGQVLPAMDLLREFPSGVQLSFLATAFILGTPVLPLSSVPFQEIVGRAEAGRYRARPAHVFDFEDIVAAHALMESGQARGKIVVRGKAASRATEAEG